MGLYNYHEELLQKALKSKGMEMLFGSHFPTVIFKQGYLFETSAGETIAVRAGSIARVKFFCVDKEYKNGKGHRYNMTLEFPTHGSAEDMESLHCPICTIHFYCEENDMRIFATNGIEIADLLSVLKEDDETAKMMNCVYKARELYYENYRNYRSKMEIIEIIGNIAILFWLIFVVGVMVATLLSDVSVMLKIASTIGGVALAIGGCVFWLKIATTQYAETKEGKHYLYDFTTVCEKLAELDEKSCEAYRK